MKRIAGWTLPIVALGLALAAPQDASAQDAPPAAAIAAGKTLYHGAALCANCHGQNGEGSGIAPKLNDKVWLHAATPPNWAAIEKQINDGVPAPKESMIPMLPKGGSGITAAQVKEVAAYVWSLSNP